MEIQFLKDYIEPIITEEIENLSVDIMLIDAIQHKVNLQHSYFEINKSDNFKFDEKINLYFNFIVGGGEFTFEFELNKFEYEPLTINRHIHDIFSDIFESINNSLFYAYDEILNLKNHINVLYNFTEEPISTDEQLNDYKRLITIHGYVHNVTDKPLSLSIALLKHRLKVTLNYVNNEAFFTVNLYGDSEEFELILTHIFNENKSIPITEQFNKLHHSIYKKYYKNEQ